MHIHRLSPDPRVSKAAKAEFENSLPTAMSAFSLVELKGNYISYLVLLRRKVAASNSFNEAYARAQNSGERRALLMISQLVKCLDGFINFQTMPWNEIRNILLTHLDAQIAASWEEFQRSVSYLADDFHCNRATEAPQNNMGNWNVSIPKCSKNNTKCKIIQFMRQFNEELKLLIDTFNALNPNFKTKELDKIQKIANQTIFDQFPWEGNTCRNVADLLIGLQSKSGLELVSSNYKEHLHMHKPLGYKFREFPIAQIRSK